MIKIKYLAIYSLLTVFVQINGAKLTFRLTQTICQEVPNLTVVAHETDCRRFYTCIDKQPKVDACPDDFHFVPQLNLCMPGSCTELKLSQRTRIISLERVADDCSAFMWHYNGMQGKQRCPKGHYFDVTSGGCLRIEHTVPHLCSCIMPEHTVLANEYNCHSYYSCVGGRANLQVCPQQQYYDERVRTCLPDVQHVCVKMPESPVSPQLPVAPPMLEAPQILESPQVPESPQLADSPQLPQWEKLVAANSDFCRGLVGQKATFQPHPYNCRKYFVCVRGQILKKHCPAGYYFHSVDRYCRQDIEGACAKELQAEKLPTKQVQAKNEYENKKEDIIIRPIKKRVVEVKDSIKGADNSMSKETSESDESVGSENSVESEERGAEQAGKIKQIETEIKNNEQNSGEKETASNVESKEREEIYGFFVNGNINDKNNRKKNRKDNDSGSESESETSEDSDLENEGESEIGTEDEHKQENIQNESDDKNKYENDKYESNVESATDEEDAMEDESKSSNDNESGSDVSNIFEIEKENEKQENQVRKDQKENVEINVMNEFNKSKEKDSSVEDDYSVGRMEYAKNNAKSIRQKSAKSVDYKQSNENGKRNLKKDADYNSEGLNVLAGGAQAKVEEEVQQTERQNEDKDDDTNTQQKLKTRLMSIYKKIASTLLLF